MSRTLLALSAAAVIGAAAPASAFNVAVDFPTLTYPTVTKPDVSQGCTDLDVTKPVCTPTSR